MTRFLLIAAFAAPSAVFAQAELVAPLDRSTPIKPGPEHAVGIPPVAADRLGNGMRVLATRITDLPIVAVTLVLPSAGAAAAHLLMPGREGVAAVAAALLDEGTAAHDAVSFATALDEIGASFSATATKDGTVVSIFALKSSLDDAMRLVAEAVRAPLLAPEAVDRVKRQMISSIQEAKASPNAAASRRLAQRVYGSHPYGSAATEASIAAIDAAAVASFHDQAYQPESAVLSAAGDISLDEIKALAEKNFGSWAAATNVRAPDDVADLPTPASTPVADAPGTIEVIDMPGAPQSFILIGQASLTKAHPDYFALRVLAAILGGPNGRVEANLRERRRWAYYARTGSAVDRHGAELYLESPIQTDKTADAVGELLKEIRRMQDEPVPAAELDVAKKVLKGSIARSLTTIDAISELRASDAVSGVPDSIAKALSGIGAVTEADVQRVAKTYLKPDASAIVIAGDAARIKDGLAKFGPVRVLPARGGSDGVAGSAPPPAPGLSQASN